MKRATLIALAVLAAGGCRSGEQKQAAVNTDSLSRDLQLAPVDSSKPLSDVAADTAAPAPAPEPAPAAPKPKPKPKARPSRPAVAATPAPAEAAPAPAAGGTRGSPRAGRRHADQRDHDRLDQLAKEQGGGRGARPHRQ